MIKHPWEEPAENEADSLDTLMTLLLVIATACLGAFMLGLVYQLAQPWMQLWT